MILSQTERSTDCLITLKLDTAQGISSAYIKITLWWPDANVRITVTNYYIFKYSFSI
jgi:hypothetical protein